MLIPNPQTLIPNPSLERHRFVLWFPVLLALGIGVYFAGESPQSVWRCAFAAATALAGAWISRKRPLFSVVFIALFAVCLGATSAAFRTQMVASPMLHEQIFFKRVTGTVYDIQQTEKKIKLFIENPTIENLDRKDTPKRLSISIKAQTTNIKIGDDIAIQAMLFPPPEPAMPGAYDFARMYYFDQLGAVGFSPRVPEILQAGKPTDFEQRLTALRLAISNDLQTKMGTEESAVASAMMVGEQSRVSEEVSDAMRDAGIYHILSISGLHLTLACGIVFFTVRLLLVMIPSLALNWPVKKIAAIAGLISGFAYVLLAGYPVPAVRSYAMVACVLLAILFDRKGISIYSLAWAASLILLALPESLLTASFQMTFAATLAIVALYERFGHVLFHANLSWFGKMKFYFLGLILTSLAASLFTTPLVLYNFNRMAVWGVMTNMLMVPLSSFIIMPAIVLAFVLMPFGAESPALWILNLGIHWMIEGARYVASLPYASIAMNAPSFGGLLTIVFGGLWICLWQQRWRWLGLVPVALGFATIMLHEPYDILVNKDAKRVAYRLNDASLVFIRGKPEGFEPEIWLRNSGVEKGLARKEALGADSGLACDKTTCTLEYKGRMIITTLNKKFAHGICESGADIIITDRRLDCKEVPIMINRDFIERHGATGIRIGNHIEITSAERQRGHWPWSKQILVDEED